MNIFEFVVLIIILGCFSIGYFSVFDCVTDYILEKRKNKKRNKTEINKIEKESDISEGFFLDVVYEMSDYIMDITDDFDTSYEVSCYFCDIVREKRGE